jgi:hypothetical protein
MGQLKENDEAKINAHHTNAHQHTKNRPFRNIMGANEGRIMLTGGG